ncbi:MAG TPA: ribose 5-phosphate isomerase B [Desulfobacter postgatei]|jgi:ribose 5-phosphate isomerase B|uniref:ribose 5-phosphate isomerase B n=1 Tax=Desulfobacter sp. TaxID=2294 RepID=UPI000E804A7B|nr:ribose 5-phosphate isomerase B [Desulfobacter sp.]MBP9599553.1 ribose 5-phosphate isomerase B [Desulfobacter sp.]HBT88405.1 ribose 5-phosphate isomerase B [Desulfobacter sp.]HRF91127.1 ribose 5-phosphate isomerase B [Desulfobacter postgatei]
MEKDKQIIIGSDHAAFELKEKIKDLLAGLGYEVEDAGTHSTASVNYADFGKKVAQAVSDGTFGRGILLCGTGLGMSMQANRFKGVRAALCSDIFSARMSRQHNDANILVMGGRVIGDMLAFELVREWLATPFEGGRHLDRIRSLD